MAMALIPPDLSSLTVAFTFPEFCKWKKFTWFSEAQYNEETSKATMTFSPKLAEVLAELKWVYSKINLQDFGKLQSRYAIRLYEIALSFAYLKGKQGNKDSVWYFQ
jgi:plasmid replication initiation protein